MFYRRHRRLIFNFLLMKLRSKIDAEEAFQETFLRVHKYILKYDPQQSALNWVFAIARNAAIDLASKNARLSAVKKEVTVISKDEKSSSADIGLEAQQNLDVLMQDLSPDERTLIQERFLNDESIENIAAKIKVKPDALRQRMSRLLRKIKTSQTEI